MSSFMKIRPVAAKLFHADRQTDMHDDANSRFSQYCEGSCKAVRNSFFFPPVLTSGLCGDHYPGSRGRW